MLHMNWAQGSKLGSALSMCPTDDAISEVVCPCECIKNAGFQASPLSISKTRSIHSNRYKRSLARIRMNICWKGCITGHSFSDDIPAVGVDKRTMLPC